MARILIVDDEPVVLEMLQRFLERNDFDVSVARDGDEALAVHRKSPADLVVTDILMPGREGFETIRELRKLTAGLKIIAISGGGRNEPQTYLRFAITFGADRAFAKPLDLADLLGAVRELLGRGGAGPLAASAAPRLDASGA